MKSGVLPTGLSIIAVVFAGIGLWHTSAASPLPTIIQVAEPDPRLDELARQIEGLRRAQAVHVPATKTVQLQPAASPQPEVAPPQEEPPPPLSEQERLDNFSHNLRQEFSAQARDPEWSDAVEAEIAQRMNAPAFEGSTLLAGECQSSLCRVEVSHLDEDARDRFMETLPQTSPFDTDGFIRDTSDDHEMMTTLYFSRRGADLPAQIN